MVGPLPGTYLFALVVEGRWLAIATCFGVHSIIRFNLSEKGVVAPANGYERGIDFVLRHRFATLLTFIGTVIATGYPFVIIPKGFFPQQDTGVLYGTTESGQDVSFPVMYRLQQEVGRIVMADPAVDTVAMGLGSGVGAAAQNTGRMFIQLKPFEERDVDIFA